MTVIFANSRLNHRQSSPLLIQPLTLVLECCSLEKTS